MNLHSAQDVLARTIWGEARGEGERGMLAVANVVLNRAAQPSWWGTSIISVCLKRWQFSCWNTNDPNLEKLKNVSETDPQFKQAMTITQQVIAGTTEDITNGATHYFYSKMPKPPRWAQGKKPCAVIGNHLFFKNI